MLGSGILSHHCFFCTSCQTSQEIYLTNRKYNGYSTGKLLKVAIFFATQNLSILFFNYW